MKRIMLLCVGLICSAMSLKAGFNLPDAGQQILKLVNPDDSDSIFSASEDIIHAPTVSGRCAKGAMKNKALQLGCAKLKLQKINALINPISKHLLSDNGVIITMVTLAQDLAIPSMDKLKKTLKDNFTALKDMLNIIGELNKVLK